MADAINDDSTVVEKGRIVGGEIIWCEWCIVRMSFETPIDSRNCCK